MGWYTVTKRINGRDYLYLQMTYRSGGKVKTKNKYIGPVSGRPMGVGAPANLPVLPSKPEPIKRAPKTDDKARSDRNVLRYARMYARKDVNYLNKELNALYKSRKRHSLAKRYLTPKGLKTHFKIRRLQRERFDAVDRVNSLALKLKL